MGNYDKVIFDEDVDEYEPQPPLSPPPPPPSKKKLSQKQIDALAKGRARVAENRKNKLIEEKKDKKFIEEGIKIKIQQKEKKKKILRSQKEQEHYDKLQAISTKKDEPLPPPPIIDTDEPDCVLPAQTEQRKQEQEAIKLENFYSLREEFLGKCENVDDFEEMLNHLDTITDEDIVDDEKLLNKLNNILVKYNE